MHIVRRLSTRKRVTVLLAVIYAASSPIWGPVAEGAFHLTPATPDFKGIAAIEVEGLVTAPRDTLPDSYGQPKPRPTVYRPTTQPVRLPSSGRCGGDLPPCWVMRRESGPSGSISAYNPTGCSGRGCYGKWQCDPRTCDGTGSEAEQDAEARRVWNNGKGCSHWNAC